MLLSLSKKFIFIHVYKTAGASIAHALCSRLSRMEVQYQRVGRNLYDSGFWRCWKFHAFALPEHASALEIRQVLAPDIFEQCFKFAFVRNPWALQLSLYRYVLSAPDHAQHEIFSALPDFEAYIEWLGAKPNGRHRVQCDFLMDECGAPLVDFVGRFERLSTDFAMVAKRWDWPADLPHLNKSEGDPDFRKFYTPRTRDIVAGLHRADIDRFGYDF